MMSSDSQAMGRVGEVIIRTWQTAHKMKVQRGAAARTRPATTTISASSATSRNTRSTRPSRTGSSRHIGSVEAGKLADLVLWTPAFFGVKPDLVIKGGAIAAAPMGDPNASIPTPQPVHYRPMFGAFGRALAATSRHLRVAGRGRKRAGGKARRSTSRWWRSRTCAAASARRIMIHNGATPHIEVDPETYEVRADGELLVCEPAKVLPMAQRYFLF